MPHTQLQIRQLPRAIRRDIAAFSGLTRQWPRPPWARGALQLPAAAVLAKHIQPSSSPAWLTDPLQSISRGLTPTHNSSSSLGGVRPLPSKAPTLASSRVPTHSSSKHHIRSSKAFTRKGPTHSNSSNRIHNSSSSHTSRHPPMVHLAAMGPHPPPLTCPLPLIAQHQQGVGRRRC